MARHWIEQYVGIPCQVEVASEYRYRQSVTLPVHPNRYYLPVGGNRGYLGGAEDSG